MQTHQRKTKVTTSRIKLEGLRFGSEKGEPIYKESSLKPHTCVKGENEAEEEA